MPALQPTHVALAVLLPLLAALVAWLLRVNRALPEVVISPEARLDTEYLGGTHYRLRFLDDPELAVRQPFRLHEKTPRLIVTRKERRGRVMVYDARLFSPGQRHQ
jgi:hypothetical protein